MSDAAEIDYLSIEDLLDIATGILDEVQLRDPGLLASAALRPEMSVFGAEAYPTFPEKAAALMHSIVRNHPLVDGNKRLAWSALRAFCLLNRRDLRYTVDDAEAFVVGAAAGELELAEIAEWIDRHILG